MITKEILDQYELTIGIECHVQLKTKTKVFAAVGNDAREAEPNSLTTPLCFGMPGTLPVLNKEVVSLAVRAGLAMNAEIAHFSKFDRKHYFYPDLPKGYQITQFDQPTVGSGYVDVEVDGKTHRVGITRAHIEEDAGKSSHPAGSDYSLVDLNRAGTPLIEIVSEPDIHSAKVARAFAQELYLLMKYADVSDVDLFHGNMRFDVNVSVAKHGANQLGTRAEVKNLNSFKSIERVVEYEHKRQVELLEKGKVVVQETRGWDDAKLKTVPQRSKEEADDYRYFPEPDLPPIEIDDTYIESVRTELPLLPPEIRQRLRKANIDDDQIQVILMQSEFADIMLNAIDESEKAESLRRLANWLAVDVQAYVNDKGVSEHLTYSLLSHLSTMLDEKELSSTSAKQILLHALEHGGVADELADELNLRQVSDDDAIESFVNEAIEANEQAANDVRNGEMKAIGFLVGDVMKRSKGQANPQMVQKMLRQKLGADDEGS